LAARGDDGSLPTRAAVCPPRPTHTPGGGTSGTPPSTCTRTEDAARTHRVSLRTLQFIRAAGHDRLLDTPPTAPGHRPSAGADPTLDRDASAPSEAHQPLPDRSQ
jgi:hypothetical protein